MTARYPVKIYAVFFKELMTATLSETEKKPLLERMYDCC